MLDIKLLRKDKEKYQQLLQSKDPSVDLSPILALDEEVRKTITLFEEKQAKRKLLAKQIGEKKREKKACEEEMQQSLNIGEEVAALEKNRIALEEQLHNKLACLPNAPLEQIKQSLDPKDNVCIKSWGEKPSFTFPFKNHVELNEKLSLFDFKRATKTSGSGFVAYKGWGARLEWALINYMLQIHLNHGFEMWLPPLLVRSALMFGSAHLPKFADQQYKVPEQNEDLYLLPTAEAALNGLHYEEILEETELPKLYVAYTPCFRREAGAAGSQERGLIRMHQFNKVEMFAFATPEQAEDIFSRMLKSAEEILEGLRLHYRSMLLVTGDMSFAAQKTVDVEVFLPGQNRYYEVSSISNCSDFQSRRSKTRLKRGNNPLEWVYTLNGSGLATSRLMVALLENNQQEDGSILIPEVLQPYLEGKKQFPVE